MRIKRIEIIGFKSFCDKTVLNIDEPITAVVGPNGCGKSNIVDAIRWCMGEQSAKHLRGGKMEDVIFAGSDTRGPAGMAEVSLTFEQVGSAHTVTAAVDQELDPTADPELEPGLELEAELDPGVEPEAPVEAEEAPVTVPEAAAILDEKPAIDYSQYGEVTIGRRLFRDGTSEYFINKTPSRLRDVQEFFLGTGVGTKAYSIIEQGRVGMIVSAKPQDRRLIIEEAAGITKFKKKKEAAERKMEQTRQNLLRVSDVVEEIDKRLGSLRRQAQKAERYKKYRAEMRDIELWSASHRFLGYAAEERLVAASHEFAAAERDTLLTQHHTGEAALTAERAEAQLEEKVLAELTQALYDVDNRVKLGESQVEFQTREAVGLEERAAAATAEIESVCGDRERAAAEHEAAAEEARRLDEEADQRAAELARAEEAQQVARARLGEAQEELDAARAEVSRAQADIARAEGQLRALERRAGDLELRLSRVTEEQGRAEERQAPLLAEIETLDAKLAGLRQLRMDLGREKEGLEQRLVELKELAQRGEAEVETLRTELHRRRSRLVSLKEIQERYEGFARGTRAVMQHLPESGASVRGLFADVVEASPELEPAVEALLGERLGSVLVESRRVGLAAVDFLKQRAEGRSTFIPVVDFSAPAGSSGGGGGGIEVIDAAGVRGPVAQLVQVKEEYRPVAEHLFGDALVVESLPRALELLDAGVRRTMVTLDGDLVDPCGVVTGGSRGDGAGVLQQKREIRELEEICASLETDLADAQARHVAARSELGKVGASLDAVKKQNHESEITLMAQEKDLARFRSEAERLAERLAQLVREREEIEAALAECARELADTRAAHDGARLRQADAERAQLALIEGVTMARSAADEAAGQATEAKVVVAGAAAAQRAAQAQKGRLELQVAELDRRVARLEQTMSESVARAAELRGESGRLAEELVGLREERGQRSEELGRRKGAHEQRISALSLAEVELRALRQHADKAAAEAARLEMRLHDIEAERRHLLESMLERHRVDVGRELHDYHLRPPVGEAEEARLRELRELIERMGEINLTAIEEFEELNTRYEFLTGQKADLENALGQLERAITKINKTSRKLFRETFDAVNAKFKEVFPRLFRGGQAELRLVGGDDDVLDAGVEIFAQPPGKKNVTVDLLSGGEKALTAVSMIFAIFLIKPSPFCLLDEVDAPLDEANVGRYNELVREMTDVSQFIVITHNKRTMEIADDLYGVTMEEPGCSKLVSVKLRGLESRAKAA